MSRKQIPEVPAPQPDSAAEWLSAFAAIERPTAALSRLASTLPTEPESLLRVAESIGLFAYSPDAIGNFAERGRSLYDEQRDIVGEMRRLASAVTRSVQALAERGHCPGLVSVRAIPPDALGRANLPAGPVQVVYLDQLPAEHSLSAAVDGWTLPTIDGASAIVLGRIWPGGGASPWYRIADVRTATEALAAKQQADRDAERARLDQQRRDSEAYARRRAEAFAASSAGVQAELAQMRAQLAELAGASR